MITVSFAGRSLKIVPLHLKNITSDFYSFINYNYPMAIKPICDICELPLNDYGAILLSPPDKKSKVTKYHLCKVCFKNVLKMNKVTVKNKYRD